MIGTIHKGNTPLMHFSFATDSDRVVPLPSNIAQIRVWVHDSVSVRQGAGTLSNLNAAAGTVDYLASPLDTANEGTTTIWPDALLGGETVPRDFDPQHVVIQDPRRV